MSNLEKNNKNEVSEAKKDISSTPKKEYVPYEPIKAAKTEDIPNPEKAFDTFENPVIDDDEMYDNSIDPKKKMNFAVEGDRKKVLQMLGNYDQAKTNKGAQLELYYNKISELLGNNLVDFQKIIEESADHMMAGVTMDNSKFKNAIANMYKSYMGAKDDAVLSDASMESNKRNRLTNNIFRKYGPASKQYKIVSRFDEVAGG